MQHEEIDLDNSKQSHKQISQTETPEEQPSLLSDGALAASAEESEMRATDSSTEGSSTFGKFASAQALVAAYNNLQSEFTKKCQKLSQLEKQASDNAQKGEAEHAPAPLSAPLYETSQWNAQVVNFLSSHADAKPFASEISALILSNPKDYSGPNALEKAWATVASKHFVPKEKLSKDESFLNEYVFSNPDTKAKVMQLFLSELEQEKPPVLILQSGVSSSFSSQMPKTMEEAKNMVHNLFL